MINRGKLLSACVIGAVCCASAVGLAQKKDTKPKAAPGKKEAAGPTLVIVNGVNIAETDLQREFRIKQVPEKDREGLRTKVLNDLIDARLIEQFLASRKTTASKQEIDEYVNRIRELAKKRGGDPDKALAELGYTPDTLRDQFALPLAWKKHVERIITAEKMREYFSKHRPEYDGTQVRASQILIQPEDRADDSRMKAAEEKLAAIRTEIAAGKIKFADAAKQHSDAPSKVQGGDVGWFPYRGKMPEDFSREAFALKTGEMSQPFRSPFGIHLLLATERRPGDLSLEDVRDEVLADLSRDLWTQTASDLRKSAKIEWKTKESTKAVP